MGPLKRALRSGFRALLDLYFRSVEELGERPSEATSGRVFVANHSNALIDPILVLTHAPCDVSPLAKSTLWDLPGLSWLLDLADAVPVMRRHDNPDKPASANDEMFDKIAEHLQNGGNVLVFPEGTSHNEPSMIRLKTGAARMLDRARARGATNLTFQAVGLEFDSRSKFRSRAVVAYGPVRRAEEVDGAFVESATDTMRADLSQLVIEGKSWEERRLVLRIAELLRNDAHETVSFSEAVRISQGVERARDELRERAPELAAEVERSVRAYFDAVESLGLTDEEVSGAGERTRKRPSPLGWMALPLAPIGAALYWLPYQLPRLVAHRTDEVDQHSTLKLATGLAAYPVWAAVLTAGAWTLLPSRKLKVTASAVILTSPFAALYWKERLAELRVAARRQGRGELEAQRRAAMVAINKARDLLG